MRWSWPIGRLFGIPLRVHVTFPLLLAWIAFSQWQIDRDVAAVVSLIGLILTVFAIVVLHELGHALAARRYGVKTRDITLLPIGGLARLEHIPKDPKQELVIALAGPAVNVVIAVVLGVVLVTRGGIGSLTDVEAILAADPTFDLRLFALRLVAINVWLVVFNLLPAFPMDGGRVLRALLSMKFGNHAQATAAAAAVGRTFAMLFGVLGLFVFNSPLLVLIAVFVYLAGTGEAAAVQTQAALEGSTLESMMITDLRTVAPDDALSHAAQLVIDGFQQDFPVIEHGTYVGMLSRADLVKGLSEHGRDAPVRSVMRTGGPVFDVAHPPEQAFQALATGRGTAIPVVRDGRLVGLLTSENVMEYLMIRQAVRGRE